MSQDRNEPRRNSPDPDVRPLPARSVVASLLLGTRGGALPGHRLVRTGQLFGISEGTIRVALSRMVAAGELVADDGRYRLAGRLEERQRRQEAGIHPAARAWDGTWLTAVVGAGSRPAAERAALRVAMVSRRFAELRDGVWLRPANIDVATEASIDEQCEWFAARHQGDEGQLAGRLWDLSGWAERGRALLAQLATVTVDLETGPSNCAAPPTDPLARPMAIGAAAVRHLRDDPLLPPELLPAGWPGDDLRAAYDRFTAAFQSRVAAVTDP